MFWFIFISSIYLTILVLASIFRQKAAPATRRVALVIGNSAYKWTNPLTNPVNDAADVADALTRLGFDVVHRRDLGKSEMEGALREFKDKARGADWALVYYAGHGIGLNGDSWLIPVDAGVAQRVDLPSQAISIENVLDRLSGAKKLRIVIFDACRNCLLRTRLIINEGFVRVDAHTLPRMKTAPGEIVFFAARHGATASDGKEGERNSPFAKALLKYLAVEGLELGKFFRRVTSNVLDETKNEKAPQEPFVYGHIPDEDFYLNPPRRSR